MKTVREIFRLPVNPEYLCIIDVEDEVAHAINNVDALADALEAILPHVESNRELGKSGESAHYIAQVVLNTYRGTK